MRRPNLSRTRQGELFSPPAKLPELPQKCGRRWLGCWPGCWRNISSDPTVARQEVGDE